MKCKENNEVIDEIIKMKNLRPNTIKNYHTSVETYTEIIGRNIKDLIKEAIFEEESNISWRNRKLRKYLIQYKEYLNSKYRKGTAKKYYTTVCAVYRAYEVEINQIPVRLNNNYEVISYDDIPSKEEISKALDYMNICMKSLTLLIISSGLTIVDVLNLTVQDFLDATKDYHNKYSTISEQLKEMNNTCNLIVGTWKLRRQKTNKYFYTFTTPEANTAILDYLIKREVINPYDKLFDIQKKTVYRTYKQINQTLQLGKAGPNYNRLRPHMFRKYHASHLKDYIGMDYVDALQGRGKSNVRESYFYENPKILKEIYMDNMQHVTIHNEKYENITLSEENSMLHSNLDELKDNVHELELENKKIKENIHEEAQKAVEDFLNDYFKK